MKKDKLLILDLDETLIYSTSTKLRTKEAFQFGKYYVYLRPDLKWFLQEISNYFILGIWSTGDEEYVVSIVEQIMPSDVQLEMLWDNKWCTQELNNETRENIFKKNLSRIESLNYKSEQIIIVDDKPFNIDNKNNSNVIAIEPYLGDQNDIELRRLFDHLLSI